MQWYTKMGRRVWPFEVKNFFIRDRRVENGPTVEALWGQPQHAEEESMVIEKVKPRIPKLRTPETTAA
jgi:anaerobic magnesium-protoporphyrin IX monomethyl ester cyclase